MSVHHEPAIVIACLVVVAASAITDFFTRKIPNLFSLGGLALGIVFHGVLGFVDGGAGAALRGVLLALGGALICALMPAISFARRQMGGGDVKLFAAIGAMTGPLLGMDAQMSTFLFVLVVVWPWRAIRAGVMQAKLARAWAKLRGQAEVDAQPTRLPPVVLAPSILLGLCVALVRNGALPW